MNRLVQFAVRLGLCVMLVTAAVGTTRGQTQTTAQDPRIGKKILVVTAGAELRTPKATVWRAYLGDVFTVTLANGEWLWIHEKGGWLWEKDTVMFSTAVEELSRRVTAAPTAENYQLRGIALLAHQQYDRAIADFNESLRRQPRIAGALNNRGQAHYLKQDYAAAVSDFSASLKEDPKSLLAFNNRALAWIAQKNYAEALDDLKSALTLVPEYPEALNNRGVVHQKLKQYDKAVADFSAALKIDPRYVDALGNRAFTYRLQGNYRQAILDLEQAISLSPDTFEVSNDLAWLLATAKDDSIRDPARSLKLAQTACALSDYKQWNTLDTLAAAFAENGKFDDAATWLGSALELAPAEEQDRLRAHLELISAGQPVRE